MILLFSQHRGCGHLDRGTGLCRPHLELPQPERKLWCAWILEPERWALLWCVSQHFCGVTEKRSVFMKDNAQAPTTHPSLSLSQADLPIVDLAFMNTNRFL